MKLILLLCSTLVTYFITTIKGYTDFQTRFYIDCPAKPLKEANLNEKTINNKHNPHFLFIDYFGNEQNDLL